MGMLADRVLRHLEERYVDVGETVSDAVHLDRFAAALGIGVPLVWEAIEQLLDDGRIVTFADPLPPHRKAELFVSHRLGDDWREQEPTWANHRISRAVVANVAHLTRIDASYGLRQLLWARLSTSAANGDGVSGAVDALVDVLDAAGVTAAALLLAAQLSPGTFTDVDACHTLLLGASSSACCAFDLPPGAPCVA